MTVHISRKIGFVYNKRDKYFFFKFFFLKVRAKHAPGMQRDELITQKINNNSEILFVVTVIDS